MAQKLSFEEAKVLVKQFKEDEDTFPKNMVEPLDEYLKDRQAEKMEERISGMSNSNKQMFYDSFKDEIEKLVKVLKLPFPIPNGDFNFPYRSWSGLAPDPDYEERMGPVSLVDVITSLRNLSATDKSYIVRHAIKDLDPGLTGNVLGYSRFGMLLDQLQNFMDNQYNKLHRFGKNITPAYKIRWGQYWSMESAKPNSKIVEREDKGKEKEETNSLF